MVSWSSNVLAMFVLAQVSCWCFLQRVCCDIKSFFLTNCGIVICYILLFCNCTLFWLVTIIFRLYCIVPFVIFM